MELMHIESGPPLDQVRRLIQEYAASLNFDLCFQHLDRDLRDLPGEYALPYGRLVLATENDRPAGCVAIRRLEPRICEMKRLYVRPEFRRKRLGRILSEHVIAEARIAGYAFMRLDTIAGQMKEAISLYRSLGFREIAPYYYNPIPRALYMELDLR